MPGPTTASPDQIDLPAAFFAAARALARGGSLGARLDTLAAQGAAVGGGERAIIYFLDGEQGLLLPAGSAGLGEEGEAGLITVRLPSDPTADDGLTGAIRARRPAVLTGAAELDGPLGLQGSEGGVALLPLVTEDETGTQAVQGLLVVGLARRPSDPTGLLDRLGALADLAAAAIHQARLERAISERSEWLERVAHIDPLTGLTNRRAFERMLEHELARAGRQGTALSLAIFDVDGLTAIDHDRGAEAADQVLRRVGAALAESVRLVDTVARLGGDEFALLAPGSAGRTIAERVASAVADGGSGASSDRPAVTMSVGLARFPEDGASGPELLAAAEQALRAAKAQGRGTMAGSGAVEAPLAGGQAAGAGPEAADAGAS